MAINTELIDGMPLNLPTHAHGQGYSDMNIVINGWATYIHTDFSFMNRSEVFFLS